MVVSVKVISNLALSYVEGDISAADFANKFSRMEQPSLKSHDIALRALVSGIHAQIFHFFHSLISENEFRQSVEILARQVSMNFSTDPSAILKKGAAPSGSVEVIFEYA
jgi:hypothetical protein